MNNHHKEMTSKSIILNTKAESIYIDAYSEIDYVVVANLVKLYKKYFFEEKFV